MANINKIKIVLVEHGKTGKWLAQQLGKSTCTVSKWYCNTVQPDFKIFVQIASLLEMEVADLIRPIKNDLQRD